MHAGTVLQEHVTYVDCRRLTHIPSVFLEGETQDCNLLVCDGVEEAGDDLAGESSLLVLVHVDNHLPVSRTLVQTLALTDVNEVENVLLEARSTEANGSTQELRPDPSPC